MLLEREEFSIRFDIKKRGEKNYNIDFGVTSDIVSFYSSAKYVSEKELLDLKNFLNLFIQNNLTKDEYFIIDLDEMEDDNTTILTFTNNNTLNGVDVGERLMELRVCYPTNYKTMNGDFFGFALYPEEIKLFVDEIENKVEEQIIIPCIFPKEEKVPIEKLDEELSKIKKDKFEDIQKHEKYVDKYDDVVYHFIERGNGSHAQAQRILDSSYVRAAMAIDALVKYGYIAPSNMYYKTLITKKEFDEIIAKRG